MIIKQQVLQSLREGSDGTEDDAVKRVNEAVLQLVSMYERACIAYEHASAEREKSLETPYLRGRRHVLENLLSIGLAYAKGMRADQRVQDCIDVAAVAAACVRHTNESKPCLSGVGGGLLMPGVDGGLSMLQQRQAFIANLRDDIKEAEDALQMMVATTVLETLVDVYERAYVTTQTRVHFRQSNTQFDENAAKDVPYMEGCKDTARYILTTAQPPPKAKTCQRYRVTEEQTRVHFSQPNTQFDENAAKDAPTETVVVNVEDPRVDHYAIEQYIASMPYYWKAGVWGSREEATKFADNKSAEAVLELLCDNRSRVVNVV